MSAVNLKFRNNTIQLASDQPEKLIQLSERVNVKLEELQAQGQNMSDLKLSYMLNLIQEAELQEFEGKVANGSANNNFEHSLSKAINQVSEYIDHLSDKFEKN